LTVLFAFNLPALQQMILTREVNERTLVHNALSNALDSAKSDEEKLAVFERFAKESPNDALLASLVTNQRILIETRQTKQECEALTKQIAQLRASSGALKAQAAAIAGLLRGGITGQLKTQIDKTQASIDENEKLAKAKCSK
jgi:hypothetical protein